MTTHVRPSKCSAKGISSLDGYANVPAVVPNENIHRVLLPVDVSGGRHVLADSEGQQLSGVSSNNRDVLVCPDAQII
jgi:hypothetical protein